MVGPGVVGASGAIVVRGQLNRLYPGDVKLKLKTLTLVKVCGPHNIKAFTVTFVDETRDGERSRDWKKLVMDMNVCNI